MNYTKKNNRISCGPVGQDWYNLTVWRQGLAPIHIKNWSDFNEKQPRNKSQ